MLLKSKKVIVFLSAIFISAGAAYFTKRTFFWSMGPVVVDYWAFAAGIFLVGEGLWRVSSSKESTFAINFFRVLRIGVGICIFTIHFLQFVRDGKLGA